ncbi:ATP-dependent helicase HrpB [Dongia soli]|uniref:ATP-dependent helicase HrpB n=1 Tax=Dongia soli TaxID=600628 RepID=A0ABU5E7V4_9PROT|nr:ATP-dependent helicase HrpB [Dongia soli]MDY0882124.1 ATP-dependent helicase HrpB [Dongia soli]
MTAVIQDALPIETLLPDIRAALAAAPNLVLEAPPGAGKTTMVPLALRDEAWLSGGKIVMLEPRRLAARSAAHRMANLLGEEVGETVGYRVRLDRRVGPKTRIEVVTTGLFLRQLQADPTLPGIGAVLFDEFHERTIDSDLALAFCLEAQAALRDDLRLLVMSATLDGAATAELLPQARRLTSEGRMFPVETRYLGDDSVSRIEDRMAGAIRQALQAEAGDILAFLPGTAEIRRVEQRLGDLGSYHIVLPLYGDLPLSEQDRAIRRDPQNRRKIVLATSIAETSLTIDGVRLVVDSGLRRVPRFDPVSGMSRLTTTKVSQAAATQRRGRAGRTQPGICYRLWSPQSERALPAFEAPEILAVDLAPLALELAVWGITEIETLKLLDPPPAASLAQARELLAELEAIDDKLLATSPGKAMAALGVHPRLAHMMVRAKERGLGALACDIAAILSERDPIKQDRQYGPADVDLRDRLDVLQDRGRHSGKVDRPLRERIRQSAKDWRRQLDLPSDAAAARDAAGAVLALAYPDRLAQKRGRNPDGMESFRLSNGRGAVLGAADPLANQDFLAIGALDGDKRAARIFLAAPITLDEIEADFGQAIIDETIVAWNPRSETVDAKSQRRLWSLVLAEKPLANPPRGQLAEAMATGIRQMGLACLPWTPDLHTLRARIALLRRLNDPRHSWPDLSDDALLESLETWLLPYLDGKTRRAHLANLDLREALLSTLDWQQRQALDRLAPTHLDVPSGSRLPLDYEGGDLPVLAVRLQEMFGATDTPTIADGKVQVLLHLLSPARRPVQVTQDLKSFWANGYRAVKADLKGQYPKHYWPDDPLIAEPTARAKPRPRS